MAGLRVSRTVVIPEDELRWTFSPSSGPGGQHANRSATRAELTWNVARSASLGPRQKARVTTRLAGRIDRDGDLRLASDRHRSQLRNRAEAERRLVRLVADALRPERRRVATEPTRASRERRLGAKHRRSEVKRMRRVTPDE